MRVTLPRGTHHTLLSHYPPHIKTFVYARFLANLAIGWLLDSRSRSNISYLLFINAKLRRHRKKKTVCMFYTPKAPKLAPKVPQGQKLQI